MKGTGKRGLKRLALLLLTALLACGCLSACQAVENEGTDDGAAAVSAAFLAERAADIIYTVFGIEVAGEDLIVPEDSDPDGIISITGASEVDEAGVRRYCHVFFERETGAFVGVRRDRGFAAELKDLENLPPSTENETLQDKKKLAEVAMEKLAAVTGAKPKAYFVDGIQTLFDPNYSISTSCHILLDNGDYYVVDIVFPGYMPLSIIKAPESEPFVDIDKLTAESFGGDWGVF